MALDICFDVRTFLERTCRSCSRYYPDDANDAEIKFYDIYIEAAPKTNDAYFGGKECEMGKILSDEISQIFEEITLWKLNIKPNDGLPQQICHECLDRFRRVKSFREECLDSQKVLESYFKDFDKLLESASLGRSSPKDETPITVDDLVSKVLGSPSQPANQHQQLSPLGSPNSHLSPKYHDVVYAESSMGTPPPLFDEIQTEPIDVRTMENMKSEGELQLDESAKEVIAEQQQANKTSVKTSPSRVNYASSDDDSSTPTSDDDICSSDAESEPESTYSVSTTNTYDNPLTPLQCKICFSVLPNRSMLKEHRARMHPQEKPYICDICASAFKTKFLLTQHKLRHNRPDSFQCEQCSKYFRSQLHLQRHVKNFHLTSTYTCHICHEKFEKYTQIRFQYHVRQHGEKRFHCEYCEKSFHQKIHLKNHERTHTKEQPFCCSICGKAYRTQVSLQEHILKHNDPLPFKCSICMKGYTQRSSLRNHYRSHAETKKKTFDSSQCEKNYSTAQNVHRRSSPPHSVPSQQSIAPTLTKNMPRHSSACGYCGKTFAQANSLSAHMKTHSQQTPKLFECQYCEKTFQNKQLHKLHEQQHKKDGAFKCSFCSETFLYRSNLGEHMLTHLDSGTGDEDYLMDDTFNSLI